MHGDLNINLFILVVLMFVLPIMFLIIRSNIISILLGCLVKKYTTNN
jgi:hypothetical protein